MIDKSQIRWSQNSNDPHCRVFFVGKRVFRAFEEPRKLEVEAFMDSELFAILQERGLLVKTWISEDIRLDDYAIIVEHEHVECIPSKWMPYACLVGALKFHLELDTLCRKYGYALRDVGFDNVTIHNGQYCFIDFGSFRKVSNVEDSIYTEQYLTEAIIPLALYHRNKGFDFVADTMIDYYNWFLEKSSPSHNDGFNDFVRPYLRPLIKEYKIKIARFHSRTMTVHCYSTIRLINAINTIAARILRMPKWWRLIRITNVYSPAKAQKWIEGLWLEPRKEVYKPTVSALTYSEAIIDSLHKMPSVERMLLWGNYNFDDLKEIRRVFSSEIVVMTNDRVYADAIFRKTYESKENIYVLQSNVMMGRDLHALRSLQTNLLVIDESMIEQMTVETHTLWAEKASMIAQYMLMPKINSEQVIEAKLSDYWTLKHDMNTHQWFINKNRNDE